jgi:hypothetical protein
VRDAGITVFFKKPVISAAMNSAFVKNGAYFSIFLLISRKILRNLAVQPPSQTWPEMH